MEQQFRTDNLAVGYNRRILLQGIDIDLAPGKILTLIGPNGAGKSTVLKTITRQLDAIHGDVRIGENSIFGMTMQDFAKQTAVVLTERVRTEMMTCVEVLAMGRYPYTNLFGKLTAKDHEIIVNSLNLVHARELADVDFGTLSDGQKQRILLARAICQEPDILILDEPTAYLDIRFKIDLLHILQEMAKSRKTTVIMSLHEVDLALKISDELLCIDGKSVVAYGSPEKIIRDDIIDKLYNISAGSYNVLFGSIELPKVIGEPEVFVISGNGCGTPFFRELQKRRIPFAAGILYENDVDYQTAIALSDNVISTPPFESMPEDIYAKAVALLSQCSYVLDSGAPTGTLNQFNEELIHYAVERNIPVVSSIKDIER